MPDDVKISNLPPAEPLTGTEIVPIVQEGETRQVTAEEIAALADPGGGDVTSVNGKTGVVVLDKYDIGLPAVDNTSDLNKPLSYDQSKSVYSALDSFKNSEIVGNLDDRYMIFATRNTIVQGALRVAPAETNYVCTYLKFGCPEYKTNDYRFHFSGFGCNSGSAPTENVLPGNDQVIDEMWLTNDGGLTWVQAKFGGNNGVSIASAALGAWTDAVIFPRKTRANGTIGCFLIYHTNAGQNQLTMYRVQNQNGERVWGADNLAALQAFRTNLTADSDPRLYVDYTGDFNGVDQSQATYWGPDQMVAKGWDGRPVVLGLDDSIGDSRQEYSISAGPRGNLGYVRRWFDTPDPVYGRIPHFLIGMPGVSSQRELVAASIKRWDILDSIRTFNNGQDAWTVIVNQLGNNDIGNPPFNAGSNNYLSLVGRLRARYPCCRIVAIPFLCQSTSTDFWTTKSGQATTGNNVYPTGTRYLLRNEIENNPAYRDAVINNHVYEDPTDPGIWKTDIFSRTLEENVGSPKAGNITSLTWSGGLITAICDAPHDLTTGKTVAILGATPAAFNVNNAVNKITVIDPVTFTIPLATAPSPTTATGTITWAETYSEAEFDDGGLMPGDCLVNGTIRLFVRYVIDYLNVKLIVPRTTGANKGSVFKTQSSADGIHPTPRMCVYMADNVKQEEKLKLLSSTSYPSYAYDTLKKVVDLVNASGGQAGLDAALFGVGTDSDLVLSSGVVTLTRDIFFRNLTINGSGSIRTNGFRLFVSGILDIENAPANCITNSGFNGTNSPGTTGGTGATSAATGTIGGGGNNGTSGAAGGTGNGATMGGPATATPGNGGKNGGGGKGGNGASGTGGAATSSYGGGPNRIVFARPAIELMRGPALILGGTSGVGGSSGGGDGTAGGGGGGGGGGAGCVAVFARTIRRGATTAVGAISAEGGTGGTGGTPAGGNRGAGAGGGGGGGGFVYVLYRFLTGATATNAISVSGGNGGNGGNGTGTGGGGDSGLGAGGGSVTLVNLDTNIVSDNDFTSSNGGPSVPAAGSTGGSGANTGFVARVNL